MEFGLTEFQQMISNSSDEFLAQECQMTFVRDMELDARGCTDEFWAQIVGQGWTGIGIPEEYGGTGGDFLDLAVLIENTGKYLMPGPLFSTVILAGMTILDAGSNSQKADWLPRISDGSLLSTMAFVEQSGSYEWEDIATQATLSDKKYIISGTKVFVPYAHSSELIIIPARTSDTGITLFAVDSAKDGLDIQPMDLMSCDKNSSVTLDGVTVDASAIIGEIDCGGEVFSRAFIRAVIAKCIQMTGSLTSCLDLTLGYVKQRSQFGRSIATFQAIQHHCSNMAIDLEGSRHVAYQAAWALSTGIDPNRYAHIAKAWLNESTQRISVLAHQSHGAIGFTHDYDLQMHTRWLKSQELLYGNNHYHKEKYLNIG